ncbi:MAG: PTS fructose transporter subunit IIA [Proteobacteria bacterium]|nr:PTS fructose transporter subunit IIA [Pseudomonadota bacterium]
MIGIVLVTHGKLGHEFLRTAEHIMQAPLKHIRALAIAADDDGEERRAEIAKCVEEVNSGQGVVVLVDMFGGTPSNLSISILKTGEVEVVAGLNLPMLIKLAKLPEGVTLAEAVDQAQEAAKKYIIVASKVLES